MRADDFYEANPARRDSGEVAFGGGWVDARGHGPFLVTWLVDTGDVIAFYMGSGPVVAGAELGEHAADLPGAVIGGLLGALAGALADGVGELPEQLHLLGHAPGRAAVERALDGWAAHEGDRDGFAWLADRLLASAPS